MDKGGCDKCLSESSPLAITTCGHKFCVKCILYLWTHKKKVTEQCICPVDGVKMTWLRPCILPDPEEIRFNQGYNSNTLLIAGTFAYGIHYS
ncbi:hypothetical protein AXX17_AT2G09780 [Arabidopsis thaliana]|uniref:RING-type domain-containing protein n=1 Tax=Arabidopsis thaliana TaxID=3702 RepID=A0A178VLP7_ARATH|nr:hypothetical protein AXX17_AT2G09780 [Arabidopsis thaliana]